MDRWEIRAAAAAHNSEKRGGIIHYVICVYPHTQCCVLCWWLLNVEEHFKFARSDFRSTSHFYFYTFFFVQPLCVGRRPLIIGKNKIKRKYNKIKNKLTELVIVQMRRFNHRAPVFLFLFLGLRHVDHGLRPTCSLGRRRSTKHATITHDRCRLFVVISCTSDRSRFYSYKLFVVPNRNTRPSRWHVYLTWTTRGMLFSISFLCVCFLRGGKRYAPV